MTGADFLTRHPSSEHRYLAEVHLAVVRGEWEPDSVHRPVSCDELLPTYQIRAKNLRRFLTPHAIELRHEVEHFCQRLSLWNEVAGYHR